MGGFDNLDTAARVRDLIKKGAARQVQIQVPQPIAGRVVSVDLINLKAMVWFTGDPQPVEVNLLSNTIPGEWSTRDTPSGVTNDSVEGYGSVAVCQKYNGQLYVVDVITGGQFAFNLSTVNLSISEMHSFDGSNNIAGDRVRSLISVRISSDFVEVEPGGAIVFGPFLMNGNESPAQGATQVSVTDQLGTKNYDFGFVQEMISASMHSSYLDQWYRILPTSSSSYSSALDWDLDIAYRETEHGLDRDEYQSTEIWFRLVNQGADADWFEFTANFDSTLFQTAQGFDKKFMCEVTQSASLPIGYAGFHDPDGPFSHISDWTAQDRFGRVRSLTQGWDTADTGEAWLDESGASGSTGTTAGGAYADGQYGYLQCSATNMSVMKTILPDVQGASLINVDAYVKFLAPATALTQDSRFTIVFRRTAVDTYYRAVLVWKTAGTVSWELAKYVSGVSTTLNSGATAVTYTSGQVFAARVSMTSTTILFRFWKPDVELESASTVFTTTDASISTSGRLGLRFTVATGSTNTLPYGVRIIEFRAGNNYDGQVKSSGDREQRDGAWRNHLLRLAASLEKTAYSSSPLSLASGRLTWVGGSIYLGNVGSHRNGLIDGKASCSMPASGETIPILPTGTFATVNSSGIPLTGGQSLWLGIPPGTRNMDMKAYLFIIDDTVVGESMGVPEWAMLIGACPVDSSTTLVTRIMPTRSPGRGIVFSFSDSSASAAIGTSEAAAYTSPGGVTFFPGRVYKVTYSANVLMSVATNNCIARIRLNSTAGTSISTIRWYPGVATTVYEYAQNYFRVSGTSPITATNVLLSMSASAGTVTISSTTLAPALINIEDVGSIADVATSLSI